MRKLMWYAVVAVAIVVVLAVYFYNSSSSPQYAPTGSSYLCNSSADCPPKYSQAYCNASGGACVNITYSRCVFGASSSSCKALPVVMNCTYCASGCSKGVCNATKISVDISGPIPTSGAIVGSRICTADSSGSCSFTARSLLAGSNYSIRASSSSSSYSFSYLRISGPIPTSGAVINQQSCFGSSCEITSNKIPSSGNYTVEAIYRSS